jgi:hypothetical protein
MLPCFSGGCQGSDEGSGHACSRRGCADGGTGDQPGVSFGLELADGAEVTAAERRKFNFTPGQRDTPRKAVAARR